MRGLTLEFKTEEGIPVDMGKDGLGYCSDSDPELHAAGLRGSGGRTSYIGNIST